MAKTRMNSGHRDILNSFAKEKVNVVVDRKLENKLYVKILSATNTMIRKKYPEDDMVTLRKYDLARVDHCVRYTFPNGRVDGFTFRASRSDNKDYDDDGDLIGKSELRDIPYSRSCGNQNVFVATEEFEKTLAEYKKIYDENEKLKTHKMNDCRSLINFAKYIEDVLEVIKVPKSLEEKLLSKSTSLVALSPDVIKRIQADFNS